MKSLNYKYGALSAIKWAYTLSELEDSGRHGLVKLVESAEIGLLKAPKYKLHIASPTVRTLFEDYGEISVLKHQSFSAMVV